MSTSAAHSGAHPHVEPSRALAVLSLAGLGAWALLTLIVGFVQVVHALWLGESLRHLEPGRSFTFTPAESVMIAIGALWFLSLGGVLVALLLGIIDIATRLRSWPRCVAFAAAALAGPTAAYTLNSANWSDRLARTGHELAAWDTAQAAGLVVIPLLTMTVAWLLLALRRPSRP